MDNEKIVIICIFLVIVIIASVLTFDIKENFSNDNTRHTGHTNIQDINTNRDCHVHFTSDEENCNDNVDYYKMSILDLYNEINKETNPDVKGNLKRIIEEKQKGTRYCKISFDGWKESDAYDIKNKTKKYPVDDNDILNKSCVLGDGLNNQVIIDSENNTTMKFDKTNNLHFEDLKYDDIYNSLCHKNYAPVQTTLDINNNYFMVLDTDYCLKDFGCKQNNNIKVTNVRFVKGSNNKIQDIDMRNNGDKNKIQKGFNKFFDFEYYVKEGQFYFHPKNHNVNIYKFKKDFCQHPVDNIIDNHDINLQTFNISRNQSLKLNNDIKERIQKIPSIGDKITKSQVISYLNKFIRDYENVKNRYTNANSKLRGEISDILKEMNKTSSVVSDTITKEDINAYRSITDGKIATYINSITDAVQNRGNTKELSTKNKESTNNAEAANTAIKTEVEKTNLFLENTVNDIKTKIEENFVLGYRQKFSFYKNDKKITNQGDLTDLINGTNNNKRTFEVNSDSTRSIDKSNEEKIYCTQIAGNTKLKEGYYKFFIEKTAGVEKESVDVFLTSKNASGQLVYSKVAYKYANNNNIIQTQRFILDNNTGVINSGSSVNPITNEDVFEYAVDNEITPYKINLEYSNFSSENAIKSFDFYGSKDGTNWDVLFMRNEISNYQKDYYKDLGLATIISNGRKSVPTNIKNGTNEHYFSFVSTTGPNSIKFREDTDCDILVVGGGGGGGGRHGAGGGAGGLIYQRSVSVKAGTEYNIIVGNGGNGGGVNQNGNKGSNSSFYGFEAYGGGGGAAFNLRYNNPNRNGGSGGGATVNRNNGSGTNNQGNAGGIGTHYWPYNWGGGGGAGQRGGNGTRGASGKGGNGRKISITGYDFHYAGGGGGGSHNPAGGRGHGGAGGGGHGGLPGHFNQRGGDGTNGTGGGGGGASTVYDGNQGGGNGGSGIVIIRWKEKDNYKMNFTENILKELNYEVNDMYVWYKFNDENNLFRDSSGNHHFCSPTHVMTRGTAQPHLNNSNITDQKIKESAIGVLTFGNTNKREILYIPPTYFYDFPSFTVCAWVKFSEKRAWTRIFDFGLGKHDTNVDNIHINRYDSSDRLACWIFHGTTSYVLLSPDGVIKLHEWMHVAWTIERSTKSWSLYINGEKIEAGIQWHNDPQGNIWFPNIVHSTCYIGRSFWHGNPDFKGQIGDFRIYKKALNANEIKTIYNIYEDGNNSKSNSMNLKKYPHLMINETGNPNDTSKERYGYKVTSSTEWVVWNGSRHVAIYTPNLLTNGIETRSGVSHHALWQYHNWNSYYAGRHYIKNDYKGDWVTIKIPESIYLYNIRIWQRITLKMRSPGDYKIYGCNWNDRASTQNQDWEELLHEPNAFYEVNGMHNSKKIMSKTRYNTYALCVNRLLYTHRESYVLNFDQFEIFGTPTEGVYDINQKPYKFYKLKVNKKAGSTYSKPTLSIYGPTVWSYSLKNYLKLDDTSNNGYNGIYIRYMRDNLKHFDKFKEINIKYEYTANAPSSFFQLGTTYLDSQYDKYEPSTTRSTTSVIPIILINKKIKDENTIVFPTSNTENADDGPGITNQDFYINCPSLPKYEELKWVGGNLTYTAIQAKTLNSTQIAQVDETTNTNKDNIQNVISELKRFRTTNFETFDCMQGTTDYFKDFQLAEGDSTDSTAINEKNQQIRNNIKQIQILNNNIQYLSNVRNGVKGINTNIDLSMNTTKMKVTLKDGNFTKYIKMITNYGSKDSSKDSIYIKLDTT